MKKFIFSIFAICISAPSFGGKCLPFDPKNNPTGNQYVKNIPDFTGYFQCGGNAPYKLECNNKEKVLAGDNDIYECNSQVWTKVEPIPECNRTKNSTDADELYDTKVPKNNGDAYFVRHKTNSSAIQFFCRYPRERILDDEDECTRKGLIYASFGICQETSAKETEIHVYEKATNKPLTNVKFTYPDQNLAKNRDIDAAKNYGGGKYTIVTNSREAHNIKIHQDGYKPQEVTNKSIWNYGNLSRTMYIYLERIDSNTSQSTTQTQVANSQGPFKIVDEETKNNISNVKIYTNNKGTQGEHIGTSDKTGSFTLDNANTGKGGVVLVRNGYKKTIYTSFPANGVFSMTPCSSNPTPSNTTTPQTTQQQRDKCETVYVLPSISPEPLSVCNNALEKITRTPIQTIPQPATIFPTEITSTQPNNTAETACTYTGGTYTNNQCTCDLDNQHLVAYTDSADRKICRCADGYHRTGDPVCINEDEIPVYEATGSCIPANDYEIQIVPDEIGMQRDAEDAYRNEYDNAQSWANKGTTALSTLMTGEGAMMAARAIAERKADNEAEREMAEYVSKMKCEYGGGQSVNLGDTETLPGGNEMFSYKTEFKQLAEKLKATKAALNLRPGIEAEVLYDRAETGLYQYQTTERQSGGFTSLSRALMNPEGADAEQWNAQRAETNRNLWVGGALATVGLAGSYIANRAINKDHVKKYKELEEKFNKIEQELLNKYPEVFEPEIKGEIISPAPIQAAQIDQNKSAKLPPISGEAFETGSIKLNETGKTAVEEAATLIADLFTKYDDIKSITVTATGYTDPQTISAQTATNLTDEYQTLFGDLPASYNGKIDENSELSEVRAKVVLKSLTDNLNNRGINTTPNSVAIGGGIPPGCERGNIRKQDYKKCRKINITINYTYAEPIE
jgi:flagellar motor protein MotB